LASFQPSRWSLKTVTWNKIRNKFLKLPSNTLVWFEITDHRSSLLGWQAETVPLDHDAQGKSFADPGPGVNVH
jgi:hypothetical protein